MIEALSLAQALQMGAPTKGRFHAQTVLRDRLRGVYIAATIGGDLVGVFDDYGEVVDDDGVIITILGRFVVTGFFSPAVGATGGFILEPWSQGRKGVSLV